ncbi:transposase [Nonomuraea sp. NEAU-A123]|uniref:transposase n=1 Tax=Nonomuraea sp. NEAU-A123 TaxID=2839649 RepID=UPI002032BC99|nr:transposase [Nonomuraea sp. NEAU-A123]
MRLLVGAKNSTCTRRRQTRTYGLIWDFTSQTRRPGDTRRSPLLGAQVLAEFGDDPHRYASAKARKNYAGTSPITRASGKKKVVAARFVHNDRLIDALITQAATAVRVSPGAHAYYDKQRTRDTDYNTAPRQVANRLVGILHGRLKTGTIYNEATACPHQTESLVA